jgi:CHAT domain-containing protein
VTSFRRIGIVLASTLCGASIAVMAIGIASSSVATAQENASPYDDPRLVGWAADFRAKAFDKVRKSVEADLLGTAPHLFARHVWSETLAAEGRLISGWQNGVSKKLLENLGPLPELHRLHSEERNLEALNLARSVDLSRVKDPFTLSFIGFIAEGASDLELKRAAWQSQVLQFPKIFLSVLNLMDETVDAAFVARLKAHLSDNAATLPRSYVNGVGWLIKRQLPTAAQDKLHIIRQWLKMHPRDAFAQRMAAIQNATLARRAAALQHQQKANELYPFHMFATAEAEYLIRLQKFDEARRLVADRIHTQKGFSERQRRQFVERLQVRALRSAGEFGRARERLKAALKRRPSDRGLLREKIHLELAANRASAAIPAAKGLAAKKDITFSDHELIMRTLNGAGRHGEAYNYFKSIQARLTRVSASIYDHADTSLRRLSLQSEHLALNEKAVKVYPASTTALANLIAVQESSDRKEAALRSVKAYFEKWPRRARGQTTTLHRLTRAVEGDVAAKALVARLGKMIFKDQYYLNLLDKLAFETPGPDEKTHGEHKWVTRGRLAALRGAEEYMPGRASPYNLALVRLTDVKRWVDAESVLKRMQRNFDRLLPSAKSNYHFWRSELIRLRRAAPGEDVPDAQFSVAFGHLEKFQAHFGNLHDYHYNRLKVRVAFRKFSGAAIDLQRTVDLDTDQINTNVWETSKLTKIGTRSLYRRLQRQPLNGKKIWETAERHARWSGSNIYALILMNRLREVDPDRYKDGAWLAADLLGKFGAHAQSFVDRYGSRTAIGDSERYVGWFEAARSRAYGQQKRFELNEKQVSVRITEPDGSFEVQRDDPLCGLPVYRRRSGGVVTFRYTATCDLAEVRVSDGRFFELEYDEAGQISRMRSLRGVGEGIEDVRLGYNAKGQISRMSIDGAGSMLVVYKKDGSIDRLKQDVGENIWYRVQGAFQAVKQFTTYANRQAFPDVLIVDSELDRLNASLDQARTSKQTMTALLPLARHAIKNISKGGRYRTIATGALDQIAGLTAKDKLLEEGLTLWHRYHLEQYPEGLSKQKWAVWRRIRRMLEENNGHPIVAKLLAKFAGAPLQPASGSFWLPRSYLDNTGYWRKEIARDYAGPALANNIKGQTVLFRKNGEKLIGTSKGLFARQRGVWLRYIYDESRSELRIALPSDSAKASSDMLSMAEDVTGILWLGTANGLIRVSVLGGPVTRFVSRNDGLPSPRVTALAPLGKILVAGTTAGVAAYNGATVSTAPWLNQLQGSEIAFIRAIAATGDGDRPAVLLGNRNGVFAIHEMGLKWLTKEAANDAIIYEEAPVGDSVVGTSRHVMLLRGTNISTARLGTNWLDDASRSDLVLGPLGGQANMLYSKRVYGFEHIRLDDGSLAAAVLTDRGLSIWHQDHFEHKNLPYSDTPAPAIALATQGHNAIILSDHGELFSIDRGDTSYFAGRVHDLLTDPVLKATYVARSNRLTAVFHNPESGSKLQELEIVSATVRHLALLPNGNLVFNNGTDVMMLERGASTPQRLFSATPSAKDNAAARLSSLLAASDGSIWATKGPSVFRWKFGKLTEFNFFKNKAHFPLPNNWLSRVIETVDKRIWVVASDEKHINVGGYDMRGGLLELSGDRFVVVDQDKQHASMPRFLTGYTAVSDNQAIVGTTDGFALHRGGELALLHNRKDTTYLKLRQQVPSLFLGRRGAKIGDVWLFPAAGGIAGYRKGLWFYPDRLNWILPDQHLARYGARTTHAIATDAAGRIYAGTDRGLVIYNSGGGDAVDFLVSNKLADVAFSVNEEDKLRQQRDILFRNLEKSDPRYRQIMQFRRLREEIDELAADVNKTGPLSRSQASAKKLDGNDKGNTFDATARKKLQARLKRKQRRHASLLAALQRENYQLYQLLALKPVELAALQKEIAPNDVIVQFLPTAKKLFIHVISRKYRNVLQVDVTRQQLYGHVAVVRTLLQKGALELNSRGGVALATSGTRKNAAERAVELGKLHTELHWLYRHLIRPIEKDISSKARVYIVPVGPLSYVPFSALVEERKPKVKYLIERVFIGQMPSMYLFDLALRHVPSGSDQMLIFGDPDGSLSGARKEAVAISDIVEKEMEPTVKVGKAATLAALSDSGTKSRVIHLATHGYLNQDEPEKSYLVMADGKRLDMIEVQLLDLKETDFVFLSACETGIGRRGAEYTTLAHSFAYAGAPSIVATLWKVDDASTLELSKEFYRNFDTKSLPALAKAQRAMIASKRLSHPAAWSGFIALGKN